MSDQLTELFSQLSRNCPNAEVLNDSQRSRLLTVPKQNVQCWLSALVYYFQTGDLVGAIGKAIECLMSSGVSPADILKCIMSFVMTIVQDGFTVDALIDLFNCVLGQDSGNGSEIDPPNYREVNRCGG